MDSELSADTFRPLTLPQPKLSYILKRYLKGQSYMPMVTAPGSARELTIRSAATTGDSAGTPSPLRQYARVFLALLRQEEEVRRRAPMESLLNLLEPIFMIGTMGFILWLLERRGNLGILGSSPILFYGTGFFAKYFFIYISRRMRRSFVSPRRRFPIERRLDYIFVNIVLRVVDYAVLGLLLFTVIYVFITHDAMPFDIIPIFQASVAIVMLAFGWGILNMILTRMFWLWGRFAPIIARMMILLSGALYIVDFMPPPMRHVLSYNPMVHAIALFRTGFYPNYPRLVLDTTYLAWCALFAVLLGLILERLTRRNES